MLLGLTGITRTSFGRAYDELSYPYRGDAKTPENCRIWSREFVGRLPAASQVLDLGCGCDITMARSGCRLPSGAGGVHEEDDDYVLDRRLTGGPPDDLDAGSGMSVIRAIAPHPCSSPSPRSRPTAATAPRTGPTK